MSTLADDPIERSIAHLSNSEADRKLVCTGHLGDCPVFEPLTPREQERRKIFASFGTPIALAQLEEFAVQGSPLQIKMDLLRAQLRKAGMSDGADVLVEMGVAAFRLLNLTPRQFENLSLEELEAHIRYALLTLKVQSPPARMDPSTANAPRDQIANGQADSIVDLASAIVQYKRECKDVGVKVTDEDIARAANPKWNERSPVVKCKAGRGRPGDDRLIWKVLERKPHLPVKV
jgi:hypothetical protein